MRRAYSQLAWGLFFNLISLRIGGFDILPDVVGYALVLMGLSKLKLQHASFRISWFAAWVGFAFSIAALIGVRMNYALIGGETPELRTLAFSSLALVVELVLFYGLCGGIRALALEDERVTLAARARILWNWIFALGALLLIISPFQLNYNLGSVWPLLLLFMIGMFLANLLLIFLVRRAGRELGRIRK